MTLPARVTQLDVAVLADLSYVPQVGQQYAFVLATPGPASAPAVGQQYIEILAQPDVLPAIWERHTTDTLSLADVVQTSIAAGSAVDMLSLAEVIEVGGDVSRAVSDTLSLVESAALLYERAVVETLEVGESVSAQQIIPVVESLSLTDEAEAARWLQPADLIILTESAAVTGTYSRDLADAVSLLEVPDCAFVKRGKDTATLTLTDTATVDRIKRASDIMALSEIASVDRLNQAADMISLADSVGLESVRFEAVTELLTVVDAATEYYDSASDTLTIVDVALPVVARRGRYTDQIVLSDAASGTSNHRWVVDSLDGLADIAINKSLDALYVGDTLQLNESLSLLEATRRASASDLLQIALITYDEQLRESYEFTGLSDTAVASVVRNAPLVAVDSLNWSLGDRATGSVIQSYALPGSASESLSITDSAWVNIAPTAADSLLISDTAAAVSSHSVVSVLAISELATHGVRRVLSATDALDLGESFTWFNPSLGVQWLYHPFVGAGHPGNPAPPPATLAEPLDGVTVPFQLVYPPEGPVTASVTLRAPEFGNRDRLQFQRINRETRGGTLIVYADPIWPKIQTMVVSFVGLTTGESQALLTFIEEHLGQEIGLIDWEHRYWRGVIVSPNDPVVEDSRGSFSASFEFEGEEV